MRDLKQLNKDFVKACNSMDRCRETKISTNYSTVISCYQCDERKACNAFADREILHQKIRTLRNEVK